MLKRFCQDESATTSIEYAIIGTLISILIVAAVTAIGTKISMKFFQPVANNLN